MARGFMLLPWLHSRVTAGRAGRRDHRRGVRRRIRCGHVDAGINARRRPHHTARDAGSLLNGIVTRGPTAPGRRRCGLDTFGWRGRERRLRLTRLCQCGAGEHARQQEDGNECDAAWSTRNRRIRRTRPNAADTDLVHRSDHLAPLSVPVQDPGRRRAAASWRAAQSPVP